MQIKKLVMQGFGRYVEKQILDFENNLNGKNIFVITGKTGAGKTTIFDAINFALYGDASGSSRDVKSLRSDHADLQTPTEVELVFSIRDKTYKIIRNPKYEKKKKNGEGTTVNNSYAQLTLPDGKLLTGYNVVSEEVERILGITGVQFKQLVMIPQGEFKKLLEASSSQKETIFRKIFGTETFALVQTKLGEASNKLKQDIKEVEVIREKRIRSFECKNDGDNELLDLINSKDLNVKEIITRFKDSIDEYSLYYKELEKQIEYFNEQLEDIGKQLIVGVGNNKKLDNLENIKIQIKHLKTNSEHINNQNEKLKKAQKALIVFGLEEQYNTTHKRYIRLKEEIKDLSQNIEVQEQVYIKAKESYEKEKNNEQLIVKLSLKIDSIDVLIKKVDEYDKICAELEEYINDKKLTDEEILQNIKTLEKSRIRIREAEKELEEIRKSKEIRSKISLELKDLEKINDDIKVINQSILSRHEYHEKHKLKIEEYEIKNIEYIKAKDDYQNKEELLRRNQAGILAQNLELGKACPVCGSLNHPSIANMDTVDISEQIVETARNNYEEAQKQNEFAIGQVKKYYELIKHIEQSTIYPMANRLFGIGENVEMDIIKDELLKKDTLITGNIIKLKEQLEVLENKIILEEAKTKQICNLKELLESMIQLNEANNNKLKQVEIQIKGNESARDILIKEFEGKIRKKQELNQEKFELTDELVMAKNKLEETKIIYDNSKDLLAVYKTTFETKQQEFNIVEPERNEALDNFKNKVFELGFEDGKSYKQAKLSEDELTSISAEIKEYEDSILTANESYKILQEETIGLVKVDLEKLEKEDLSLKSSRKTKIDESKTAYSKIETNKKILADVLEYTDRIIDKEEEYGVIGSLFADVSGNNKAKMSLERYVLASYFEDIIEAANLRFTEMTANQYELFRKEEVGDARIQQGLELEVLDNYTGKRRSVTTLSGGESFKASLALALGLADVVQGYAGGIQLDTMFIDEGFGTLDPESLDAAVDALVELQNDGRVVGIISHVEELKERISTHLHVSSTQNGSTAHFKH